MAKFKRIHETFIYTNLLTLQGNMYRNYNGDIYDSDFFDILGKNFDHDKGVELIETAFLPEQILDMKECRSHRDYLDFNDSLGGIFRTIWNHGAHREACRTILTSINDYMIADVKPVKKEIIECRFKELRDVLSLTEVEYGILLCGYILNQTCFSWPVHVPERDKAKFYAMALDRAYVEVLEALAPNGKLRKFNLVDDDFDFNYRLIGQFLDGSSDETIQRRFYGTSVGDEVLPWTFYGELAKRDGELLKKLLASKPKRCNILLYGAPGTGKTSFARSLARETGRTGWEVRQGDTDGRNMASGARMVGIRVCNDQEEADTSLMIVDEADELLRGSTSIFDMIFGGNSGGKSTEKGITNSLLDDMQIPAVWISNAPAEMMDESVRRRFDYSIRFDELNTTQREAIWRNVVAKHKLAQLIPEAMIPGLAAEYATSAGGISLVLENLKRIKPAKDAVRETIATLMKPHCQLMGIEQKMGFLPAKGYSLEGLNIQGKFGLEKVVKAVANYYDVGFRASAEDKPRMNLLMYGPPGTGKTEFVKYLAKTLDRKVVVMKGSDILGKYVGESEKNIAGAFRRAEAEQAILFFDEIDGLLRSRANATQSWEVTQVNELLQQMENFDGVMIAATNFCDNLDPATMRRFTFKLRFDYLADDGKKLFFERMFKTTLTDAEFADLCTIPHLTPGDFRTVRQEQFYLADEQTNASRIAALREESTLKKEGDASTAGTIGFAA